MKDKEDMRRKAKSLGSALKEKRKLANLSQVVAAEEAGITQPYLSRIEQGALARDIGYPSRDLLQRLATLYGEEDEGDKLIFSTDRMPEWLEERIMEDWAAFLVLGKLPRKHLASLCAHLDESVSLARKAGGRIGSLSRLSKADLDTVIDSVESGEVFA